MWNYLKSLFSKPEPVQRVSYTEEKNTLKLPELTPQEKAKREAQEIMRRLEALEGTPENIEAGLVALEAEYSKKGKKIFLFHHEVAKLRNERLDDPNLETREGTYRSLNEVTMYLNHISDQKAYYIVNTESNADSPAPYWEV